MTGPPRREEHPTHDQEAFGTPQTVHPHPLRTGPRRAVLAHSALRRAGSHPEHQKEWFDDTLLYLAERYDALDEQQLAELRVLGERYCRPVVGRSAPVGANA